MHPLIFAVKLWRMTLAIACFAAAGALALKLLRQAGGG